MIAGWAGGRDRFEMPFPDPESGDQPIELPTKAFGAANGTRTHGLWPSPAL